MNATPRPIYPLERNKVSIFQETGWTPEPVERVRKISPPPGLDPRTVQPVASSYPDPLALRIWYYLDCYKVFIEWRLRSVKLSYCPSTSLASVARQLALNPGLFSNLRPDVPVLCWTFSGIIRGSNRRSVLIFPSNHSRGLPTGFLPLNFLVTTFSFLYSSITHSNCVTSPSCSSEQYVSLCQVYLYCSSYINERSSVRQIWQNEISLLHLPYWLCVHIVILCKLLFTHYVLTWWWPSLEERPKHVVIHLTHNTIINFVVFDLRLFISLLFVWLHTQRGWTT